MTVNAYRGEVSVEIDGVARTLRYPWSAIAELRDLVGGDVLGPMQRAMIDLDLSVVCRSLAVGLRESWPDVTVDQLMTASPPIIPTMTAVQLALYRAFHGAKAIPEAAGEPRPNPFQRAREIATSILSWRPWKMPSFVG